MQRSCASCRRRGSPGSMLRIAIDGTGTLRAGRSEGRGAWLCRSVQCVQRLQDSPRLAKRALGSDIPAASLCEVVEAWLRDEIARQLATAMREGCVRSGTHKLREEGQKPAMIIEAGGSKEKEWTEKRGIRYRSVGLSAVDLGAIIGRGPRRTLGLNPSHLLQSLDENLRLWVELR